MRKFIRDKSTRILATAAAFALTVSALFFRDLNAEYQRHQEFVTTLTGIRHLDHQMNELLLRSHAFLDENYDATVSTTNQLRKLCSVESSVLFSRESLEAAADDVNGLCAALDAKLDAVENFKSANAIVKNALHYLPTIVAGIESPVLRLKATSALNLQLQAAYAVGAAGVESPHDQVVRLASSDGLPPAFARQSKSFARALSERSRAETVIFTSEVETRIQDLLKKYFDVSESRVRSTSRNRNLLIVVCSLLGFGLVFAFLRVQRAKGDLSDLNRTLEEKVRLRTDELERALERERESRQLLSQTAKMSALGEMAGNIAHEINTPLGAILLCAEHLEKIPSVLMDERAVKTVSLVLKTVHKISRIVQGLRSFCRDQSGDDMIFVSTRELLEETLLFCHEKFRTHGIEVKKRGDLDAPVRCRPGQIQQVLLNLLSNAFDEVAGKAGSWIEVHVERTARSTQIRVVDSGQGIAPVVANRLMQPGFTTKAMGKGTGLGLPISRSILEGHGGTLRYVPNLPNTTFEITLPDHLELKSVA